MSLHSEKGKPFRAALAFCCAVPTEYCKGKINAKDRTRCHATVQAVRSCARNWLINIRGATQISPREFALPNEGPILVLSKKPLKCKAGKASTQMGKTLRINRL